MTLTPGAHRRRAPQRLGGRRTSAGVAEGSSRHLSSVRSARTVAYRIIVASVPAGSSGT